MAGYLFACIMLILPFGKYSDIEMVRERGYPLNIRQICPDMLI
jgi:hypothetical protein